MKYKATILPFGSRVESSTENGGNLLKSRSSDGGGNFHNFRSQTITRQLRSAKGTRFRSNNVSHSGLCLPDSPSNGRQPLANTYERVHGSTSVPRKLTFPRFDRVKPSKLSPIRITYLQHLPVHLHASFFFSFFRTRKLLPRIH